MNQQKIKPIVSKGDSYPLEILRKEKTELSQNNFCRMIGISISSYTRLISSGTPPKLSPEQTKRCLDILNIDFGDYYELWTQNKS